MVRMTGARWYVWCLTIVVLVQTGCATMTQDTQQPRPAQARHCEGSESITSTHVAALPIPIVAFFMPKISSNSPDSGKILDKCRGKQVVNRKVEANYALCAPVVFLTTVVSLGIVGVCPTFVHYEADVID